MPCLCLPSEQLLPISCQQNRACSCHDHREKHPAFHVKEKMTVKRPMTRRVGADEETHAFSRLHVYRMLVRTEFALAVVEFAPEPVQMNRMFHHSVVDQNKPHSLAKFQTNRLVLRERLAVEAPDKPLHVSGQMKFELPIRRARITPAIGSTEVGIGQHTAAIPLETNAWRGEPLAGAHRNVVDFGTELQLNGVYRTKLSRRC